MRDISQVVETLDAIGWQGPVSTNMRSTAVEALESGKVLYFPRLAFELSRIEEHYLTPATADAHSKNVSFDPANGKVKGAVGSDADIAAITAMMRRYYEYSRQLVETMLPRYASALEAGRTSFRPVEIRGRPISARKDDTRLHIDAFPSSPTGGRRILRVFTNVNREAMGRHWRLGAPFEDVAGNFIQGLPKQKPGAAWLLKTVRLTKGRRTDYDHLMLKLHDTMKADDAYQARVMQNEFHFPPGSTWLVFTDVTSHAAMGGQHLFEQTFYLPVSAMENEAKAPLRVLERLAARPLV
jgi:3-deoxy-D-manno-oct-2-ulosonic acid (Kdo) hydroxylase